VRVTSLFRKLLNLQGLRVTAVRFTEDAFIISIARTFWLLTCPGCKKRVRGRFEEKPRSWRHLSIWGREVILEGTIRRLRCPRCEAVRTEDVPWARPGSPFTRVLEDAVALLAQKLDQTAVAKFAGVSWVTVGSIAERVVREYVDPMQLAELRRISVDEISFRRRHGYLTVVTDHDRGRVVWVGEGKSSDTLKAFFKQLGPEACARIEIVTMDMSAAYIKAVRETLPQAEIAFDHFHIARLANEALNEVRRELVRDADEEQKAEVKNTMWALLHRWENAREAHHAILAQLQPHRPLGRAYLLKECLLFLLRRGMPQPDQALQRWLARASRSRLRPFVRLARTLRGHLAGVLALLRERITNGLAEGMNNKIRLLSHRAYGFHSASALIATIKLCCGGIELPELQLL
jgi:transposase